MGAIVIPIVLVVVALVAGAMATARFTRRRRQQADEMRARGQTLHYTVPNGIDPSHVILELSRAGFEAVPDTTVGGAGALLIGGRSDRRMDREKVRRILSEFTDPTASGDLRARADVRFLDE